MAFIELAKVMCYGLARYAIGFLLLLFTCSISAAELTWLTDLRHAQALAKTEGKLTLLFFHGSDWCPPCAEMQHQVFDSSEFTSLARQSLVLVDVDFPQSVQQSTELKQANSTLKSKFNVGDSFPSIVVLNTAGDTVFQEAGYSSGSAKDVLQNLERHTKPAKSLDVAAKFKNLSVEEFARMAADSKNIVLDVRTSNEFQAGHLPRAINLDVNSPDFAERAKQLDKGQTYLVHCAAGVRSVKACEKLNELNFPKLYNLPGGFKAWEKSGQPVEK